MYCPVRFGSVKQGMDLLVWYGVVRLCGVWFGLDL